jgi:NAD+ kinase
LNSYWADGLIVSTPTGSSGYSLSCGGPILFPKSASFVVTPIAPHNLNVRPVIVPDDQVLSFEIEGRGSQFLASLDSRSVTIDQSVQIAIRKADFSVNLVRFEGETFLKTLRQKMLWGLDNRN